MGLNDQQEADEILDEELADCENISIEEDSIKSAPGYVQWDDNEPTGSPADYTNYGPYWGGVCFKKSDGSMIDVRQRQDILEYSVNGAETWIACTLPTVGSPAATVSLTQKQPTFAILNDTCIFANGQVLMYSTDGITWYNKTNLITGGLIPDIVFNNAKNRLIYVIKDTAELWWSEINTPLNVLVDSWQFIDPNTGSKIVGLGLTPSGSLLCFKESSLYELDDITSGMIGVNFVGNTRCASHHTICTTKTSVIFSSWASIASEYIDGRIRSIAGNINVTGRNDVLKYELFTASYYNNKYRISFPDGNVSSDYNSQEYVFYLNNPRKDNIQPYAVTRNRRYIGCYFIEDMDFDYGRDVTLYIGDSRTDGNMFSWINDFRDSDYIQGLNGEAQDCYFITKFFYDNVPYYQKKFKKLFVSLKLEQETTFQLAYRFDPYGSWIDEEDTLTTGDIDWTYDDATTGGFSEGYSFYAPVSGNVFADIENVERPRGIQFKISWSQINDVTILGLAYQFKPKSKFK
jgi:hypothetical protein